MKILLCGGGNMGRTYADSFTANHTVSKAELMVLEHLPEKAELFKQAGFINSFTEAGSYIAEADFVILAVKPQDAQALYPKLKAWLRPQQLVITIMAGVTMAAVSAATGSSRIVRVMPNLPAQIGMGISGFTSTTEVTKEELFSVQNLLNTTGKSLYFDKEDMLDAVTAVSGSGPAYVYYFMQAMIDKALTMGFSTTQATTLVEQTFMGATHLLTQNHVSATEMICRVASRGGTTEAALNAFKDHHTAIGIGEGMQAALDRAVALGRIA